MEVYPEAKVVLTVRKPSTWPESVKNAIMRSQRIAMTFPASWIIWIRGGADRIKVRNSNEKKSRIHQRFPIIPY